MIESNACRAYRRTEIDLLPWADPYIMQLFAESEQWNRSGLSEPAVGETRPETARSAPAVTTAQFCSESWSISAGRRPLTPRRRRIESERLLARC
jgi:hypothetical protein